MKKTDLNDIISKYNVNGRVNSMRFTVSENTLKLINSPVIRNFLFEGTFENFELPDCEIGIYDTESLLRLISAVDNEFKLSHGYERNKITSLNFSDSAIDVKYMLADTSLDVFQKSDGQKDYPDTHVSFELDKETMDRFIRAKNALKDVTNFAMFTDENQIDIVVGYSDTPTNRIKLTVEGVVVKQITEPLQFNADIVKDIFAANKNAISATFEVSLAGLLTLKFQGEGWNTKYLIPKIAA